MPTYEYVCSKCGHQFEALQSIMALPLSTCPKDLCGQRKWGKGRVKRGIGGGAGLLFKGTGFYITDYRSEGYKAAAKKDTSPATTSGETKTSTEKTPAKPEAKPAAKKAD
ncbi:MAG: zinc ribbon domain-containing protein [Opitutaceae bacterium]|nr:zinc ribbon domain-containing protein [Verrucomicrobiales bacterium]